MGFLYPLFFIALAALSIPILIHLFNLRRYKKMDFPSLYFLKQYIVKNKKMSDIYRKWLLLARLLTLLFLIIAFAQPFINSDKAGKDALTVLYIDNSPSSSYKLSQLTVLDKAKQVATDWISAQPEGEYIYITNDHLLYDAPLSKQEVRQAISNTTLHQETVHPHALHLSLEQLSEQHHGKHIRVIVCSDIQRSVWVDYHDDASIKNKNINYYFIPITLEGAAPSHVAIDTAYFLDMPSDATQSAVMVTSLKRYGSATDQHSLTITVNGQVQSSKEIAWSSTDTTKSDTAYYPLQAGAWSKIKVSIDDHHTPYDNDFYIAARAASATNALVLSADGSSPYLAAAINSTPSTNAVIQTFRSDLTQQVRGRYPLIIFDQVTSLSDDRVAAIKQWLSEGQAVGLFFGMHADISQLNAQLKHIAPITITKIDTSLQQTVDLQSSHPLLQQVLAQIPDNVQLPYSQYAYKLQLGITTAAQPVLKFRDGSPFLVQMQIGMGKLYMCASPLTESATSLVSSHYFAPIVQKMLSNNATAHVFAATVGQTDPLWVDVPSVDERRLFKIVRDDWEAVPIQQPRGIGTNIFIPKSIPDYGHYHITNGDEREAVYTGINASRLESDLTPATTAQLRQVFGADLTTVVSSPEQLRDIMASGSSFPLWKIAIIIALIWMVIETYLLVNNRKP